MNDDRSSTDFSKQHPHTELNGCSPNFRTDLARQLQAIAPEAVSDGKIDVAKLRELLAEDAGNDSERFGLFWPGKKRAMRAAQSPSTATLRPVETESSSWDTTGNIFVEGDNLEVLKLLQKHYHSQVKLIYIDPPYNTGKDFIYPDNYKEGLASYLEFTGQLDERGKKISTNSDSEGRYHSNWLNMMYPRLKLARNLLKDDGAIFISIDDHEQDNLKKLCNEIYGEHNFVNCFMWLHGKGKKTRHTRTMQQYVLCYARNKELLPEWTDTQLAAGTFTNVDDDPRGNWFSGSVSFSEDRSNQRHRNYFSITSPSGIVWTRQWQCSRLEMDGYLADNKIYFGPAPDHSNVPRLKIFPDDSSDIIPSNLIDNVDTTRGAQTKLDDLMGGHYFDNPKPVDLIKHLITISGSGGDALILDYFSGSGTTAQAVMEANAADGGTRRHIQVQLPEPTAEKSEAYSAGYKTIPDISKERIRRASAKVQADYAAQLGARVEPFDIGFKVYKLADTNFTKWQTDYTGDVEAFQQRLVAMRESANNDASEADLLTEILLKLGLSLTARAEQISTDGLLVWSVAGGSLIAYLNEHTKPTVAQLRAIAATEPAKIVVLDDSFMGDDELKTNLTQLCKTNEIELWTI